MLNEQIEKAATLRPDAIAVKELIARQQALEGKYPEATRLANEILAKDPVNRVAHMPIYAKVRQDKHIAGLIAEHYAFIKAATGGR